MFLSDYGSTYDDTFAMTIESIGNIITPPLPGEEGWTSKTFAEYLQNNWTLSINRDLDQERNWLMVNGLNLAT